jgi:hypothetical protein
MKKLFLPITLTILFSNLSYGQDKSKIEKPDSVSTEQKFTLQPSFVFIPMEMNQGLLKNLIDKATPENQRVKDESDTEELNFSFKITDGVTNFNNNTITHSLRLTKGDGSYRRRGWTKLIWPLSGRAYGPWVRVDCDDIRGNADVSITISLESNYKIKAIGDLNAKIDNVQCAQLNVTGIARAFGWHDFKTKINKELEEELGKIDIKSPVNKVWKQIQTPYKISNNFFLLVKPINITYRDLIFENGFAKTGIGLSFYATTGNQNDSSNWESDVSLPNLVKNPVITTNNVSLNLPINMPYSYLDKIVKDKVTGMVIKGKSKKGKEKKYGKIEGIEIYGSKESQYDIVLGLKTKIYRTIFKKEKVPVYIHAKLDYDTTAKTLIVKDFLLDSKTESGLYNLSLETIANKLAYSKIISKLQFDIDSVLSEQKVIANKLLNDQIEITEGVKLSGIVDNLTIKQMIAQPNGLFCLFILNGNAKVEVIELKM